MTTDSARALLRRLGLYLDGFSACFSRQPQRETASRYLDWPIEQQYRELKDAPGLDHFEGRSYRGWQPHVVLTAVAFTFLRLERGRAPTVTLVPSRGVTIGHWPVAVASAHDAFGTAGLLD